MTARLLPIMLLLWLMPCATQAQLGQPRSSREALKPAIAGTSLAAFGTTLTFVPSAHNLAIDLRNTLQADGHTPLLFDDYVQYLPAAAPLMLNLCGIQGRHSIKRLSLLEGGSYLLGFLAVKGLKTALPVWRPDARNDDSFPSGHTFLAITGAEVFRREFAADHPWLAIATYGVAVLVAAMRLYNNRHWLGDVATGAGISLLSVTAVYWLFD